MFRGTERIAERVLGTMFLEAANLEAKTD